MTHFVQICIAYVLTACILGNYSDKSCKAATVENLDSGSGIFTFDLLNDTKPVDPNWYGVGLLTLSKYYINRSTVNKDCKSLRKRCWSSDKVVPICGSDDRTYLNPGVLHCAQKCNETLKGAKLGPCEGKDGEGRYGQDDDSATTEPPHITGRLRIRLKGFIHSVASFLGFHVHDDGGLYVGNEHTPGWFKI